MSSSSSSKRKAGDDSDDNENSHREWLQSRLDQRDRLLDRMFATRQEIIDRGSIDLLRPPSVRDPPDKPPRPNPDNRPLVTAQNWVQVGDDESLRQVLLANQPDLSPWTLMALAVSLGQVECVTVLLELVEHNANEFLDKVLMYLGQAASSPHNMTRMIHLLAWWVIRIRPVQFEVGNWRFDGLIRVDENAVALSTWLAKGRVRAQYKPYLLPPRSSALFQWQLLQNYTCGILAQTAFGVHEAKWGQGRSILQTLCTRGPNGKFSVRLDEDRTETITTVTVDATEQEAPVGDRTGEVYWDVDEKGQWKRQSKSGDVQYMETVIRGSIGNSSKPLAIGFFNKFRDAVTRYTASPNLVLCTGGMTGLPFGQAQRQYVLDGSLWSPPSEMDLHDVQSDVPLLPSAIVVVSVDTGTIAGYLSYIDDGEGKGKMEALTEESFESEDTVYELTFSAERGWPLGLPSFAKKPEPLAQAFCTDVREKALICIVNCEAIFIHYATSESTWDRVMNIIPYEKRLGR